MQAITLLHVLEKTASEVGLYINAPKTEYLSYNLHQDESIHSLNRGEIKAVEDFKYLGSHNASSKNRIGKAWGALNSLKTI